MSTKIKISKKALEWSVLFGLICAIFCSFADFNASCEELRHNVLRLHIIANSDSKEDQAVKLLVRDRILQESGTLFCEDTNLDSAVATAKENIEEYNLIAREVLRENGFSYNATVRLGTAFFETREYDTFTLPSGNYTSLIIELGESKGKNWWCVIFPQVCVPTAKEASLTDSVSTSGASIAENADNYVIRFKTVELYEKLRKWLKA